MDNTISNNLSILYNNLYNLKSVTSLLYSNFNDIYSAFSKGSKISLSLKEEANNYPIYSPDFKLMLNVAKFNGVKITQLTQDSVHHLTSLIPIDLIDLKDRLDKFPEVAADLSFDFKKQLTFFTDIKELYPTDIAHSILYKNSKYFNLFFNLIGKDKLKFNDIEASQILVLFYFLTKGIQRFSNIFLQF